VLVVPIAHAGALAGGAPALRAEAARFLAALRARNFSLAWAAPPAELTDADPAPPAAGADVFPAAAAVPRAARLDVTARLAPAPVTVRASVSEELKWGWMQYVSFLVLTGLAARVLRAALFGGRLIDTAVVVDAPRAATKMHVA